MAPSLTPSASKNQLLGGSDGIDICAISFGGGSYLHSVIGKTNLYFLISSLLSTCGSNAPIKSLTTATGFCRGRVDWRDGGGPERRRGRRRRLVKMFCVKAPLQRVPILVFLHLAPSLAR